MSHFDEFAAPPTFVTHVSASVDADTMTVTLTIHLNRPLGLGETVPIKLEYAVEAVAAYVAPETYLIDAPSAITADYAGVTNITFAFQPPSNSLKFGVNITSAAVKAPYEALGLSNGARTGLTGFVAGLARQPKLASRNVTINNLLPGPFDTERLRSNTAAIANKSGQAFDALWESRRKSNPTQRFGDAREFGAMCAFICSTHTGYMTGQNVLMDGGSYPGTF